MPTAAIYARKSKATEKGESIENQISRGKALCQLRGWDYIIYDDFDISGKTLERPGFEKMMKDIYDQKINFVICYKLDRISRSVNDFSNLIEELNGLNVGFICIKDNFDTTTPMGRAMMYITAVFAQLERETIAERVKDNMIDRAKLGKWNGGPIPFGFNTEKKTIDYRGKSKKVSRLIINNKEANLIKDFYTWYLEDDGSVRSCVSKANQLGYKTKNNAYWSHNQMSRMLQNPLYCIADAIAYDYFKNNTDVQIVNEKHEFDGKHGLMFYNRRKPHKKTSREREESEWILTIGEHKGIITG